MIKILLAEDNPADVELTRQAFSAGSIETSLDVVEDGEEALTYLKRQGKFANKPRPHLVILDINLPKISGLEIVKIIKTDQNLKTIPVIILTSSKAEKDIAQAYNLYANCYITKPVNVEDFLLAISKTAGFWLDVVKLPSAAT